MTNDIQSQGPTKKCPKCGEEILSSATVCKHCQADLRNWFAKHKVLTGILVLIVIGIIGSASSDKNQKTSTTPNSDTSKTNSETPSTEVKPTEPQKLTPQITVTGTDISKDYSENEVSADSKYKDKIIELSGKIVSVSNGISDNEMVVKLSDGKYDLSGAMCYMKTSEKEKVLSFKKGQQVTLIGTGNSATIGSPMLKDCIVK
jgi:ribosomal protein L32